ncbi:MAG: hypothetical protein A9Z00_09105 [Thermobacillus sp. ZCTH02-B1]|uniref:YitT family protein n=1 Tax=Thermobacillus sp. ZCTH02-B1 TaxID=1858795 RepID=UPI000B54C63A|nr:YitT family protein [Thermobacillus sp. ZCTH02-B1]OUM94847.1 MAG: hypothetical protein A9Z00_09105 [Thermobacillus sp. ZCTH02-B1]
MTFRDHVLHSAAFPPSGRGSAVRPDDPAGSGLARRSGTLVDRLIHYGLIVFGSVLAAVGLELFLRPNGVATGGIAGASIIAAHLTEMQLSLVLFLFNLPFLLGRKAANRRQALRMLLPVALIALFTHYLHPVPAVSDDPLAAALGGGTFLGIGIGLILRQGNFDELAASAPLRPAFRRFDAGAAIFAANLAILLLAGFVFGANQAIYSIIAHVLAYFMLEAGYTGMSPVKRLRVRSAVLSRLREASERELRVRWTGADDGVTAIVDVYRRDVKPLRELLAALDPDVEIEGVRYDRARRLRPFV